MKLHINWLAGEEIIELYGSEKAEWLDADQQGKEAIVNDFLTDLLTAETIEAYWGIEE